MSIDKIGSQPLGMDDGEHGDGVTAAGAAKVRGTEALQGGELVKGVAEQQTPQAAPSKLEQADVTRLGEHKTQGLLVRDQLQLGEQKEAVLYHKLGNQGNLNLPGDLQIKNELVLGNEKVSMIGHKLPGDLQIKHKLESADERMAVIGGAPEEKSVWAAKLKGLGNDAVRFDDEEEGGDPLLAKGLMSGARTVAAKIDGVKGDKDFLLHKNVGLAEKSWAGVGAGPSDEAVVDHKHWKVAEDLGLSPSSNIWGDQSVDRSQAQVREKWDQADVKLVDDKSSDIKPD